MPLVACCGNHDVGDRPNASTVEAYRSDFSDDYYSFWAGGSLCIVLNSMLWSSLEPGAERTFGKAGAADLLEARALAEEQDRWLQEQLDQFGLAEEAGTPPLLVFSHVTPFVHRPDEPKGYFNIAPCLRGQLLSAVQAALAKRGSSSKCHWFGGHLHRNAGAMCGDNLEVVVTSAVGTVLADRPGASKEDRLNVSGIDFAGSRCAPDASGVRVVCVTREHGVVHRWFSLDALPDTVDPAADAARWLR